MMRIFYLVLVTSLLSMGCTTKYTMSDCYISDYYKDNKAACDLNGESKFIQVGGLPWPVWLAAPVVIVVAVAIIAGGNNGRQQPVGQTPEPQASPVSYRQQQINNGNGGGRYGNYPAYAR